MRTSKRPLKFLIFGLISVLFGLSLSLRYIGSSLAQAPSEDLPPELMGGSGPQPTPPNVFKQTPASNATPAAPPAAQSLQSDGLVPLTDENNPGIIDLTHSTKPMANPDDSLIESYIPPKAASDGYIYDPTGRRDPFRPYKLGTKIGIGSANLKSEMPVLVPPEPLQKFELANLTVVGIVWDVRKPKALIKDPNRTIHTVVKGQKIGKNEGFIAEIREGEIIVVESYEDQGRVVKDARILSIRK